MTIADYLRLLRERWITVALLGALGMLGAAGVIRLQAPVYEAHSQLFVSTTSGSGDIGQLSQGGSFVQQRVKSYTDLVDSPAVLQPVINRLGLRATPQDLAGVVTASSPLDTVLLDITARDTSAVRARDIANAVALQFPRLVADLETPAGGAASPVSVSITRSAVLPEGPASPRASLDLALGLLVGLGLGVGVAVLRTSLDRTVGDRRELTELTGVPILGAVPHDADADAAPLITGDGFSLRAEAHRQLRTNIRFLSVDRQLGSLVVTGSVPAEGKTTTAANLAIALAQGGAPVVLVDADLRRPTVADLFALPGGVGLTSVLIGDVELAEALQPWRPDLPLQVLTAGPTPPNPSELLSSERMATLIGELTAAGRTVVIDSPPLLPVTDAAVLARLADGALLVIRVGSTCTDQVASAVEILRTAGAPLLGTVLTHVPRRGHSHGYDGYGSYAPSAYRPDPRREAPPVPGPRRRGRRAAAEVPAVELPPDSGPVDLVSEQLEEVGAVADGTD